MPKKEDGEHKTKGKKEGTTTAADGKKRA